jgi:hypothetical protein
MPWYTKASLPAARYWAAGYDISGIGYVVGGDSGNQTTRTNYAYTPASDTWATRAQLPSARWGLAGFSILGIGYAAGGYNNGATSTLYAYDPATNSWSTKAPMPTARYGLAAFSISDIGYAVGGTTGTAYQARNEAYDPSTNTWTTKASLSVPGANCAFVVNNKGYAVCAGNPATKNEEYDPVTDTWSTKASKPTAASFPCAFVLSGLGYVIFMGVNEAYDPVTDTWSVKESPPSSTARRSAAAFSISGVGYMAGGSDLSGLTAYKTVEAFIPSSTNDAAAQARGTSAFSLQAQHRCTASTEFISRCACSASPQRALGAAALADGRSSGSVSICRISTIAIQVVGSSAISGQPTAPVDAAARSAGSSAISASSQYSANVATQAAGSSVAFGGFTASVNIGAISAGSSTSSGSARYSAALAIRVAGSSAIFGQLTVPVNVSARSAGLSTFSLQVQRGRAASSEFVSQSVCLARLQSILGATALTEGRTSCFTSIRGVSSIAIQVAGSSAVFGRSTAPVDVSARSAGSSTFFAVPQYVATFIARVTTSSACLAAFRRAGTMEPTIITGTATISPFPSVTFGGSGTAAGSSACSAYTNYDCIAVAQVSGLAECSTHLQRDRSITALTQGTTGAISSGQVACQARTQTAGSSIFSIHARSISVLWAQSSGSTACITRLQLNRNTGALSTGESTWLAYVRRAAAASAQAQAVSSCSVALSCAIAARPAIIVGNSLILLRIACPVRINVTARGASAPILSVAIRQPVAAAIGSDTVVAAAGSLLGREEGVYPGWPIYLDSLAGDIVITFPTYAMEWETGGDLRTAFAEAPLADYAFDLLGTRPAPRGSTDESIRFVIVGQDAQDAWQQYMDMRSKLARIGRGRLWVRDALGNRYWAYVRPMRLATTTFGVENLRHFPVSLTFRRLSDWMARSASSVTLSGNGTHIVYVSGNVPVKDLTIEIAANAVNGYASPTIENYVTGERMTVDRVASTDRHRLRILTKRWAVLESSDGGMTWSDVTPALVVRSFQVTVLHLEPTANILFVSGCPGATVTISWYDTYA